MKRILGAVLVLSAFVMLTGCQNGPFRSMLCDGYCQAQYPQRTQQTMMPQMASPMVYMPTVGRGGSSGPCDPCGVCDPCAR